MKETASKQTLDVLLTRFPCLESIQSNLWSAYSMLKECYSRGGTVYLCGNGGSASDCEHITGELMKSFRRVRPLSAKELDRFEQEGGAYGRELAEHLQKALPAISLSSQCALTTAITNDIGGDYIFAQQIYGYGRKQDVLFCISTSGNSENILLAALAARVAGVQVLSLTGRDGGRLATLSDVCIICPAQATEEIQEYHLPIYHALCAMLEEHFWGENN